MFQVAPSPEVCRSKVYQLLSLPQWMRIPSRSCVSVSSTVSVWGTDGDEALHPVPKVMSPSKAFESYVVRRTYRLSQQSAAASPRKPR